VHADEPLTKSEIETRLETNHDYSFNDLGIRSYPQLLELMGAIVQTDYAYQATSDAGSHLSKFRQADLFRKFESWLRKEGTTGSLPTEATKRDLMKYYMYRESEGWGNKPAGSNRSGMNILMTERSQVIRVDRNSNGPNSI